jgi:uncharacterized membrane protein
MRLLRIISLAAACIFTLSAITGIQRLHLSTESGLSMAKHTPASRTVVLIFGAVCVCWYLGLRRQARWGIWATNIVFLGIIGVCLWQGVDGAIKAETSGAKVWNVASQVALSILIFLAWRKLIRGVGHEGGGP